MAGMETGSGGGFKRDPNVVPMIDILLVLLIIFMMQIPLQRQTMDVQVPAEEKVKQQQMKQSDQIVLELRDDGTYAIIELETGPLSSDFNQRPELRISKRSSVGNRFNWSR